MKLKIIILILIIAAALGGGFYFKNGLTDIFVKNINKFIPSSSKIKNKIVEKVELGNIIPKTERKISAPKPLNVGGKESEAILTKARVIAETNIQRYNNSALPPLIENIKLATAAKAKVNDMFKNQYFDHVSPNGLGPGELVKDAGYDYIVTGENLILGNFASEREVVEHWMNSPGHRANILNSRFAEIGVAIIKGAYKGQKVWIGVQEFGLSILACPQSEFVLKNQIDFNKDQLDQMAVQISDKKNEIDNTKEQSSNYNKLIGEYNRFVVEYNSLVEATKNLIAEYNNQVAAFNQCVEGSQ